MKKINNASYWTLKKLLKLRELILRHILDTKFTYIVVGIIIGITFTIIYLNIPKEEKRILVINQIERQGDTLVEAKAETGVQGTGNIETKDFDISSLITSQFGDDSQIALAVAMAESRMNPKAVGDTHLSKPSIGLFQVSQIYHPYPTEQLMNPQENIKIAYEIYKKGGWNRWTTYRTGEYQKYLNN